MTTMSDTSQSTPEIYVQIAGGTDTWKFSTPFTIGRGPANDVVIPDELVSLRHAQVWFTEGEWRIRDLGSTNGLFIGGRHAEEHSVRRPVHVRLGQKGPTLFLTPLDESGKARETVAALTMPDAIADRYFGVKPPEDMSAHTAMMRGVVQQQRRKHARKYRVAVGVLTTAVVVVGGMAYTQRKQVERQRAAAEELFYSTKALELEVDRLALTAEEQLSYRERRAELERRYDDFVEALGIYSDKTGEEIQLIYRVVSRFGESEVNVPREFVNEVLRYIDRWQGDDRLANAIARATSNGYGSRIAEIMLEHDLPPDFFYLALQESAFNLDAVGPRTRFGFAKGMWQFIPATAREYGLQTGPLVGRARSDPLDDRQDFEKATRAAAEYIRDLYTTDAQASGLLVMASYNWGQTNVLRLIRSMPETPRERNFWNLLEEHGDVIPDETYGYVFRIVSAAVIGEDPSLFGFEFDPPLP